MSYWFGAESADASAASAAAKSRHRVHVPSHDPCDWTHPIVPKSRAFPPGYVAPGERLRRIAAAHDAEFDEKEQLKAIGGVLQSAEWHDKAQQRMRRSINQRADAVSKAELATLNEELCLARRAKLRQLYDAEHSQQAQELAAQGLAIAADHAL